MDCDFDFVCGLLCVWFVVCAVLVVLVVGGVGVVYWIGVCCCACVGITFE